MNKVELYPYQLDYLKDLPKNCIMAAATGTGKGQMSLEHFRRWNVYRDGYGKYTRFIGEVTTDDLLLTPIIPLLILAPASKVKTGDWERELEMAGLADVSHKIVSYDKFARKPADYICSNFVLIADEVHFIKNPTSKRGKATIAAAKVAKQFIGLSATPLPNGYKDLMSYMITWGVMRNKTDFTNHFMRIDRSRGFPLLLGYMNVSTMESFWRSVSKPLERHMNSQTLPVEIELSKKKLADYAKVKKSRVMPDGEILDSAPLLHARLRQMTAHDRVDALKSILDGTDEHVIIFYNYNVERDEILKALEDYKVKIYEQSGHKSELPPREQWETMSQSVTVAQYQSASTAIELQYASITIYFSPTYSYANFHQSMGRTRRIGQKKTPLFYLFRIKKTLDDDVWQCLKSKRDFDDKIVKNY